MRASQSLIGTVTWVTFPAEMNDPDGVERSAGEMVAIRRSVVSPVRRQVIRRQVKGTSSGQAGIHNMLEFTA